MKRSPFTRRGGLTRDAEQLVWLAAGLSGSGSRLEDSAWEARLDALIVRLLAAGNDDALNAALDQLYRDNPNAYDALADMIEAGAEGTRHATETGEFDVLLIAAPVLAWSRFSIPSGSIPRPVLANLRVQLQAHVLADGAKLALADYLFSPDQLPRSYGDTHALARKLAPAAIAGNDISLDTGNLPETSQFLSDMRYLIGAVAVPHGSALFGWQEEKGSRELALTQWRAQGNACLQPLFPACALEPLLPDAYHAACRNADRQGRPYSLRASVSFLQTTLNVTPESLRAVVAPFHDKRLEEFRIGFTLRDRTDVVHGMVWPLLDAEDETTDSVAQIESVLRECGVDNILVMEQRFPLEYCDECGAPLYPDPEGEPVHAELPEDTESRPAHLH